MNIEPLPPLEVGRIYDYDEAAPYFGRRVSGRQVRRWVEECKLPFTPLPASRGRGISGQQILDYIASHRQTRVGA